VTRLERLIYRVSVWVVRPLISRRHLGAVTGLEHVPPSGAFILVSNHSSFFDHFLIETVVHAAHGARMSFLTKQESFDGRLRAAWHRGVGAIPVDRANPGPATLRQVSAVLRSGEVLCVYPEGTRGTGRTLLPFKSGAFRFAISASVPVIPVGIAGADRILPRGARWPRPVRAHIAFGPPLDQHEDLPRGPRADTMARDAHAIVTDLVQHAGTLDKKTRRTAGRAIASLAERRIDVMHEGRDELPARVRLKQLRLLLRLGRINDRGGMELEVQELRARGLRALEARALGRLALALPIRRRAQVLVVRSPQHAMAHYVLGRWHLAMPPLLGGRPVLAVEQLRQATECASADSRYLMGYAEALLRIGAHAEADVVLGRLMTTPVTDERVRRRVERAAALRACSAA
jgi:1-acyl-sn-glycerol-3-phosphate acyltransferase